MTLKKNVFYSSVIMYMKFATYEQHMNLGKEDVSDNFFNNKSKSHRAIDQIIGGELGEYYELLRGLWTKVVNSIDISKVNEYLDSIKHKSWSEIKNEGATRVFAVEMKLKELGFYDCKISGVYSNKSNNGEGCLRDSVRAFQRSYNTKNKLTSSMKGYLTQDGRAGDKTIVAMLNYDTKSPKSEDTDVEVGGQTQQKKTAKGGESVREKTDLEDESSSDKKAIESNAISPNAIVNQSWSYIEIESDDTRSFHTITVNDDHSIDHIEKIDETAFHSKFSPEFYGYVKYGSFVPGDCETFSGSGTYEYFMDNKLTNRISGKFNNGKLTQGEHLSGYGYGHRYIGTFDDREDLIDGIIIDYAHKTLFEGVKEGQYMKGTMYFPNGRAVYGLFSPNLQLLQATPSGRRTWGKTIPQDGFQKLSEEMKISDIAGYDDNVFRNYGRFFKKSHPEYDTYLPKSE